MEQVFTVSVKNLMRQVISLKVRMWQPDKPAVNAGGCLTCWSRRVHCALLFPQFRRDRRPGLRPRAAHAHRQEVLQAHALRGGEQSCGALKERFKLTRSECRWMPEEAAGLVKGTLHLLSSRVVLLLLVGSSWPGNVPLDAGGGSKPPHSSLRLAASMQCGAAKHGGWSSCIGYCTIRLRLVFYDSDSSSTQD